MEKRQIKLITSNISDCRFYSSGSNFNNFRYQSRARLNEMTGAINTLPKISAPIINDAVYTDSTQISANTTISGFENTINNRGNFKFEER